MTSVEITGQHCRKISNNQEGRILKEILVLGIVTILLLSSVHAGNDLSNHPSPYLAMHGDDPVDWKFWNSDAFISAMESDRLIFVSIGYFSCHWCHVMQQESYQDDSIAQILNKHYISVKVDRELQPDLDGRMIDFVEEIRGSAGWPLNVFLTPEGYPVTGFTYLPPSIFLSVLQQLNGEWQGNREKISEAAKTYFLQRQQDFSAGDFLASRFPLAETIDAYVSQAMLAADELLGGFGDTSKFPNVPQLDTLLEIIRLNQDLDKDVIDFVQLSLRAMASSHLTDHVNGGFFRYTTDPDWQTPHYEKMLYDNAQLATLYLKADRQWPGQGYREVSLRTLDFIESNLRHTDGGYMSSLSAVDFDSKEGGGYLWNRELLSRYLKPEEVEYLTGQRQLEYNAEEFLIGPLEGLGAPGDIKPKLAILKMLQTRGSSEMPVDDKRLAGWNAMMLEALTAASDLGTRFDKRAIALYQYMRDNFYRDGKIIRLANKASVGDAGLEDYAQLAYAFYQFGKKYDHKEALGLAVQFTEDAYTLFLLEGRWRHKIAPLIPVAPGKWIVPDSVFISPMTLWLKVARVIPGLDNRVRETANQMLRRVTQEMLDSPYSYGSYIILRRDNAG